MFCPRKTDWSFRSANEVALTKFWPKLLGFELFKIVGVKMQTARHYCQPPRSNGLNKSNCFLDKLCKVLAEYLGESSLVEYMGESSTTYMLVS